MAHRIGNHTIILDRPPCILASAAVASKKEKEGPVGDSFDFVCDDPYFEQDSWEKAESIMQTKAVQIALGKAGVTTRDIDAIFAGDLLNQCIGSSYGLRELGIPFMGMYGACSTMAESMLGASVFLDSGALTRAVACTSSHFCAAERQYRFPLEYGGQRTPTAQWTVTGSGAAVLGFENTPPYIRAATIGTIEDLGITDANNMGAAMAPAAAQTIKRFLRDTNKQPGDFDLIITGDLGKVGTDLLRDLLSRDEIRIDKHHTDCGLMIYDLEKQDVHAGGSGCGCSASVMCGHILPLMRQGKLNEILFVATGALMSPTVVQQGESIASIAHLLYFSTKKTGGAV